MLSELVSGSFGACQQLVRLRRVGVSLPPAALPPTSGTLSLHRVIVSCSRVAPRARTGKQNIGGGAHCLSQATRKNSIKRSLVQEKNTHNPEQKLSNHDPGGGGRGEREREERMAEGRMGDYMNLDGWISACSGRRLAGDRGIHSTIRGEPRGPRGCTLVVPRVPLGPQKLLALKDPPPHPRPPGGTPPPPRQLWVLWTS